MALEDDSENREEKEIQASAKETLVFSCVVDYDGPDSDFKDYLRLKVYNASDEQWHSVEEGFSPIPSEPKSWRYSVPVKEILKAADLKREGDVKVALFDERSVAKIPRVQGLVRVTPATLGVMGTVFGLFFLGIVLIALLFAVTRTLLKAKNHDKRRTGQSAGKYGKKHDSNANASEKGGQDHRTGTQVQEGRNRRSGRKDKRRAQANAQHHQTVTREARGPERKDERRTQMNTQHHQTVTREARGPERMDRRAARPGRYAASPNWSD